MEKNLILISIISIFLVIGLLGMLILFTDEEVFKNDKPSDMNISYKDLALSVYTVKAPSEPITYEFESNGDDTCTLVGYSVNRVFAEQEHIELPSLSPSGERVTAIDFLSITPNGNLPRVMRPELYEYLMEIFEQNKIKADELRDVRQYYKLIDLEASLEGVEDEEQRKQIKEDILKEYPYAEIMSLYVLKDAYTNTVIKRLSDIFAERGNYTQEACILDYNSILEIAISDERATDEILKSIPKPYINKGGSPKRVTVPEGVTSISNFYFKGLESIDLPESLTHIGKGAFAGNTFESVLIPENVTEIGIGAFQNCSSLKEISIPSGVTVLHQATFAHCNKLSEVELPEKLITIGNTAFQSCNSLTEITIPKSVEVIQTHAFDGCSSMRHIRYLGTKAEWEALVSNVSNLNWNKGMCENYTVYCTDGEISYNYYPDGK